MSENNVLKVENVTMQFGGVIAVDNMNIEVNKGEIVSLIGPNGAGKTTAFNVITGVYAPTNGAVYFQGEKIIENHPQGKMKKLYLAGSVARQVYMELLYAHYLPRYSFCISFLGRFSYSTTAITSTSASTFLGSCFTATQERAGFPVKYLS